MQDGTVRVSTSFDAIRLPFEKSGIDVYYRKEHAALRQLTLIHRARLLLGGVRSPPSVAHCNWMYLRHFLGSGHRRRRVVNIKSPIQAEQCKQPASSSPFKQPDFIASCSCQEENLLQVC